VAAQVTLANGVNEERTHIIYLPGSWTLPWEIAAAVAGQVAAQPDPAVPFDGLVLTDVAAPTTSLGLIRTEQETLLAGGVTPLSADNAGNVSIVRLVTTRTTTNGGADLTLLDTNPIAILDYFRGQTRTLCQAKYSGMKTTDAVLTAIVKDVYHLAKQLEAAEILQHVDAYKVQFTIVRDPNYPGRAVLQIPAPWVPGLHQLFASFNLITVV
jgi:phage tail sheath gpL-like